MKEIVRFDTSISKSHVFSGWQDVAKSYLEPMHPIEVQVAPSGQFVGFVFDYYPAGLEEVRNALRNRGISSSVWVRREYAADELLGAEWLNLGTEDVVSAVEGTLRWDMIPLCRYCGFQETRWDFDSLQIQQDPLEGYRLAMVDWHPKVITSSLAQEVHKAGFTGLELVPVGPAKEPAWYALRASHTLRPLLSPPTRLRRGVMATPLCERHHDWAYPKSEFFYQREGFEALDFDVTYELFGDARSSARTLVVSGRVYQLLVKLGVDKLVAEPIRLLP